MGKGFPAVVANEVGGGPPSSFCSACNDCAWLGSGRRVRTPYYVLHTPYFNPPPSLHNMVQVAMTSNLTGRSMWENKKEPTEY